MSDGVRNRPLPGGPALNRSATSESKEAEAVSTRPASAPQVQGKETGGPHDVYEPGSAAHAQFKQHIQAATSRSLRDLHFSNVELEAIAQNMLDFVKGHPNASRAALAKGFAKAALKGGRGKLGKLIENQDKEQAEEMFEDLGNMLSESPRLAEWLESLTEQLKKM